MPIKCNTTILPCSLQIQEIGMQELCGMSHFNVTYKLFTNFLAKYIEPYSEKSFGEYQCGFRTDRSKTGHIYNVLMLYQKFYETNKHFDIKHSKVSEKGIPILL